jgi:flagellar biosynthetic protein FliR
MSMRALDNLDMIWSFILLVVRYSIVFTILPGLGGGPQGLTIRIPAILVLSFASINESALAEIPANIAVMLLEVCSEVFLGLAIGLIPAMLIAGIQTAGHLASTTMGLGASQLIDPTMGISVTSLSRIFGDLAILVFLITGGHLMVIHTISGLGGEIVPGAFIITDFSVDVLIQRGARIFYVGVMVSAPIIVALLLTQFVMGLISKAIPTVNIFIVSFPLTIGIGLILSILALPDMVRFLGHELYSMEQEISAIGLEASRPILAN